MATARTAAGLLVLALGVAGCALRATAFPHQHPRLARLESLADQGAAQLAEVFNHDDDQPDLYQGESVGAIVNRSIALLGQCGLHQARAPLRAATHAHAG